MGDGGGNHALHTLWIGDIDRHAYVLVVGIGGEFCAFQRGRLRRRFVEVSKGDAGGAFRCVAQSAVAAYSTAYICTLSVDWRCSGRSCGQVPYLRQKQERSRQCSWWMYEAMDLD